MGAHGLLLIAVGWLACANGANDSFKGVTTLPAGALLAALVYALARAD